MRTKTNFHVMAKRQNDWQKDRMRKTFLKKKKKVPERKN